MRVGRWLAFDAREPSTDPGDKWEVGTRKERTVTFVTAELLAEWRLGVGFDAWKQRVAAQVFSKGCCLRGCDFKQLPLTLMTLILEEEILHFKVHCETQRQLETEIFFTRKLPRALLLLSNLPRFSYFYETCCFQPL